MRRARRCAAECAATVEHPGRTRGGSPLEMVAWQYIVPAVSPARPPSRPSLPLLAPNARRRAPHRARRAQVLHLMRHGVTEMNVHLARARPGYGQPGFVDPMLFDTSLTAAGVRGARAASRQVSRLSPRPEVRGPARWSAAAASVFMLKVHVHPEGVQSQSGGCPWVACASQARPSLALLTAPCPAAATRSCSWFHRCRGR
jgi:hypothetical protein